MAVVREDLLSDDAAAAFEILVSERLKAVQVAGQSQALKVRQSEIQTEIGRLVDAIARLGMSAPIEQRIRQSERELVTIGAEIARAEAADSPMMDVRKTFKALLIYLGTALKSSPMEARAAVGEILGTVNIELKGREVWAQIALGPSLRLAVGAKDFNGGCGDGYETDELETFKMSLICSKTQKCAF